MEDKKVLIIAEAGVNHNGDLQLAKELIKVAADCGVDYVKFQTWITEENIEFDAPKANYQIENDGVGTQFEMVKKLELSFDAFRILNDYATELNVKFLSTPDELTSLNFLVDELNLPLIKIGSGEINNIPFLISVGEKKLDVILSTGMSSLSEVDIAYQVLKNSGAKSVSLLHCTTSYPAPYETINLKAMDVLKCAFNTQVGYSDHSEGIEVAIAAVSRGAEIIEKHFTLDKNLPGPDHKASLSPDELKQMVNQIRNVEKALSGSGLKEIQSIENDTKKVISKGIYLNADIVKGEVITIDKISFKRPNKGVSTSYFDLVINKKANKNIIKGAPLQLADLEF